MFLIFEVTMESICKGSINDSCKSEAGSKIFEAFVSKIKLFFSVPFFHEDLCKDMTTDKVIVQIRNFYPAISYVRISVVIYDCFIGMNGYFFTSLFVPFIKFIIKPKDKFFIWKNRSDRFKTCREISKFKTFELCICLFI
jgi:hypothetical protein